MCYCYLQQGGYVFYVWFVCLSVCKQNYVKLINTTCSLVVWQIAGVKFDN